MQTDGPSWSFRDPLKDPLLPSTKTEGGKEEIGVMLLTGEEEKKSKPGPAGVLKEKKQLTLSHSTNQVTNLLKCLTTFLVQTTDYR
jgi:hypothetical protein